MYEISESTWFKDEVLDGLVNSMLGNITGIAYMLLFSFIALKVGYEYFKISLNSISNPNEVGRIMDMSEITRLLTLIVLLGLYPALSQSVTGSIRYINSMTDKSTATYSEIEKVSNDYYYSQNIAPLKSQRDDAVRNYKHYQSIGDEQKAEAALKIARDSQIQIGDHEVNMNGSTQGQKVDPTAKASISIWDMLFSPFEQGISGLINGVLWVVAMIIKWGVSAYARVVFKILLVLGPLAIATSIFWKDKFLTWFEALLNTGFAFTILNILDIFVSEYWYSMNMADTHGTQLEMGIGQSIAFNCAIIGAYLSTFKLTSMFIGRPVAGAIMGKGMAVAGMIAAGAVMAVSKGAGGGAASAIQKGSGAASSD